VSGCERLFGPAAAIAHTIQDRIAREVGLTASIGVATNKLVAKIASEHRKPAGLTVVEPGAEAAFLAPKPILALWGIGPVTAGRLNAIGLQTIGDVAACEPGRLESHFATWAAELQAMARGEGNAVLSPDRERKQVGQEQTFAYDVGERDRLAAVLLGQAREVAATLRRRGQSARRVTIKLRDGRFRTQTRAATLPDVTADDQVLYQAAIHLLDRHWRGEPLRLIGLTAGQLLEGEAPLTLFADESVARRKQVGAALDGISQKFGKRSITWAKTLLAE
jgi:DNA polymerase-4